ncbi:hypothetical protein QFC22_004005 [Naganishia vaughanmartiniae]|uniref:Uncharacterized protein n=1 Tax=Naganishia vaughanmartiniae TaxID=1424756 RepID=A0ACC2X4X6_9TREE|nr:hypothetical protein QFC22_004005 [Naganishia vaughanmartiniae]
MPIPQTAYLAPPPITKNFLISPPGSPPEGWEPIVEEPPNDKTLAEDLAGALEKVQLERREWGWDDAEPVEVEETYEGAAQPWEQRTDEQALDNRRTSLSGSQKPSPPHLRDSSGTDLPKPALSNGINSRNNLPAAVGSQVILQTSTGVIVSVLPPPPVPAPAVNGLSALPTATIPRVPTAMPPRDISEVKATVESMQRRQEGREAGGGV